MALWGEGVPTRTLDPGGTKPHTATACYTRYKMPEKIIRTDQKLGLIVVDKPCSAPYSNLTRSVAFVVGQTVANTLNLLTYLLTYLLRTVVTLQTQKK